MTILLKYWKQILFFVLIIAVLGFVRHTLKEKYNEGYKKANDEWVLATAIKTAEHEKKINELQKDLQLSNEKVQKDGKEKLESLQTALVAAGNAYDSLHNTANLYATRYRQCTNGASAADSGGKASSPTLVLAELFRRADARAGELAEYVDRVIIARDACEAAHEAVRVAINKKR